ncbi:MAG: phosphoethanolamine transferase domain-containing protein, partial [Muribaculaceae bacterium]|nr:phosphoethanolamine transferase domain-containing protein [Muribaculaceae bacterium]
MSRSINFLRKPVKLSLFAAILSIFTLIAYHLPFFKFVVNNMDGGFNSFIIVASLMILMLALNFFAYYLILFLGRIVGKCILAFTFIADAISLYFINIYDAFITNKMMGNVFNTRYSEASGFFSWTMIWYILLLGILPCIYLFMQRVDYGKWKRFFANIGISLGISIIIALLNMSNWTWIDRNSTKLGSILVPWSYTINTIRWWNGERERNQKEIPLPDAKIATDSKDVCILIIGESARRANFSLYGYDRPTNPLLEKDSVTALIAESAATYTTAGVKAILDHKPSGKLYEILPNYLHRNGVDVTWRTSNWGESPLHIEKYADVKALKKTYPEADDRYDGILLQGLRDSIINNPNDKIL